MAGDRHYRGSNLTGSLFDRLEVASADDHLGAFAHKCSGDGPANPAARTGHQGNLVFQHGLMEPSYKLIRLRGPLRLVLSQLVLGHSVAMHLVLTVGQPQSA